MSHRPASVRAYWEHVIRLVRQFIWLAQEFLLRASRSFVCISALRIAQGLVRSWYIIAVVVFSAIVLTGTGQGRELLLEAFEFSGWYLPNLVTQGSFALLALSLHVFMVTVFTCFIMALHGSDFGCCELLCFVPHTSVGRTNCVVFPSDLISAEFVHEHVLNSATSSLAHVNSASTRIGYTGCSRRCALSSD